MSMEKPPFRSYTLDEDKKNPFEVGKVFTIRLNAEEYMELKADMKVWNVAQEGKMLKLHAKVGRNVLHNLFGASLIKWLTAPTRRKAEQE